MLRVLVSPRTLASKAVAVARSRVTRVSFLLSAGLAIWAVLMTLRVTPQPNGATRTEPSLWRCVEFFDVPLDDCIIPSLEGRLPDLNATLYAAGPCRLSSLAASAEQSQPFRNQAIWWLRRIVQADWLPGNLGQRLVPVKRWWVHPKFEELAKSRVRQEYLTGDAFVARYGVICDTPQYGRIHARVQMAELVGAVSIALVLERPAAEPGDFGGLQRLLEVQVASMLADADLVPLGKPTMRRVGGGLGWGRDWKRFSNARDAGLVRSALSSWWAYFSAWTNGSVTFIYRPKDHSHPGLSVGLPHQRFGIGKEWLPVLAGVPQADGDINPYRWDPQAFADPTEEQIETLREFSSTSAKADGIQALAWPEASATEEHRATDADLARGLQERIRQRIQAQLLPSDLEERAVLLKGHPVWGDALFCRYVAKGAPPGYRCPVGLPDAVVQIVASEKLIRAMVGWPAMLAEWMPAAERQRSADQLKCAAGVLMSTLFRESDNHSFLPYTLTEGSGTLRGEPKVEGLKYGLLDPKPVKDFWWGNIKFWTDGVTYYFECPA